MNVEENRLQTFTNWPADAAVSPVRIAKAGFYSVQNQTVQCFSCGIQISEWNYGDQVMARHRQLSPTCSFVVDQVTSGNVPNISHSSSTPDVSVPQDSVDAPVNTHSLTHEAVRLQSFEDWPIPHIVSPERLARAGFYYLNQRDKTKCAFCEGIVVAWEPGDDPDREHQRHFPNCNFVRTVINPRIERLGGEGESLPGNSTRDPLLPNLSIVTQNSWQELGVNRHRRPKRTKYATLESRLRTFAAWPEDLIQTPDVLAQAGFYYEGAGDQVRCFHCDGGLRHWDPQDDPWTEHARWFPKCAYVLLVKGQDFITACTIEDTYPENMGQEDRRCARPVQKREVTEPEVQAQMLTPQVITALNIGLHVGRIKQAIKEKLERTGTGFSTADAVIEAALSLQHEEDEERADSRISDEVATMLANAVQQSISNDMMPSYSNDTSEKARSARSETPVVQKTAEEKSDKPLSLEEENRILKEARLCKICMDVEVGVVFLPCGHLATCVNCALNLQDCPVCRSIIKATVRTFLS